MKDITAQTKNKLVQTILMLNLGWRFKISCSTQAIVEQIVNTGMTRSWREMVTEFSFPWLGMLCFLCREQHLVAANTQRWRSPLGSVWRTVIYTAFSPAVSSVFVIANTQIRLIESSAQNHKTRWNEPCVADGHFEVSGIKNKVADAQHVLGSIPILC